MRNPVRNPESARKTMDTNITRLRSTAVVSTVGFVCRYPGAAIGTRIGAARTPATTRPRPTSSTRFKVLVTTCRVSSGSSLMRTSLSTGMKTMLRMPPTSRRWMKNGT